MFHVEHLRSRRYGEVKLNIIESIDKFIPRADEVQRKRFERYFELLTHWNEKMNLTALTEPEDVASKHFADSLLGAELIKRGAECIDIGTGAGFPAIPLMIMRDDITMTLLDALNKRLVFLNEVCIELGLHATIVHARAEDAAHDAHHRARYDAALSRAVAPTSALIEMSVPFLKTGGAALMYKGADGEIELAGAKRALEKLNAQGRVISLSASWGERCIIEAKKIGSTALCYPRKPSNIKKNPL